MPTEQPDPPKGPPPDKPPAESMTSKEPNPPPPPQDTTTADPVTRTTEPGTPQPTKGNPPSSPPTPSESNTIAEPTESPTSTKNPNPTSSTGSSSVTPSSEPPKSSQVPGQTLPPAGPEESSNGPPAPTSSSSPLTSSTTTPGPPKSKGSSLSKGGVAAGAVFGGFVVVSLVFLTFVYYKRWKHTRENQNDEGSSRRQSPFPPTPPMGDVQQTQTGIVDHSESMTYDHNMHSFGALSSPPPQGDAYSQYPQNMEEKGLAYSSYPTHQDATGQNELRIPQGDMNNTMQSASLIAPNEHQHQYIAYSPDLMEDEKTGFHTVGAPGLAPLPESSMENLHSPSDEYRRPIPKRYSAINSHQVARNSLRQITNRNSATYPGSSQ
ncbi:hypothetical protein MferCBS49748_003197 [Microsporum ferrugineum]